PGPDAGRARRRRRGDPRRQGGRPRAQDARILSPLSVPPDVRPARAEMSGLPPFFPEYQDRVAGELRRLVPGEGGPVERAMAYTALAPSKQVRAVLVQLCAELCRGNAAQAGPAGAAIALVHA